MPTYQQKRIAHETHVMATYPDGNFRFCRYFGCGYTEVWDSAAGWVAYAAHRNRRKPAAAILRMDVRQAEMFPMSNAEAARALVTRAGRSRRKVG